MNLLRLSLNLLRRDWRANEWRVLLLALVLAVGSLATVGMFADRVRQALGQQAASLLGADLRITSTRPISLGYREKAQALGLSVLGSSTFPSMVSYKGQVQLSEIQAVEPGYPLRGKLELDDGFGKPVRLDGDRKGSFRATKALRDGTVWVDDRLLRRFELHMGDEVSIGRGHFKVGARIVHDIDQSFASFAPRVMMSASDLAATGLLQEGSRISYCLMIAGNANQIAAYRASLTLTENEKMEDVKDARPQIRTALERAEHFLGLAALTTAILAGAAMALAARRYVARHLDGCAVMRCLGAQQNHILLLFLYQFLLAGMIAVLIGLSLAFVVQAALVESIAIMRQLNLPQPGMLPAIKAAVSGLALLLGFAFLPLLQLRNVSPMRVIRREMGVPQISGWLSSGVAILVLAALFLWQAGSLKLGLVVMGSLLCGLLVFGVLAQLVLHGLARYSPASHWKHVFNNLARHSRSVSVQIVALGLGGMALLVMTLVRGDLLQSWQGKLPQDAPNRFMVNIQPDQRTALLHFFAVQGLPLPDLLPMIKARLVAIDGRVVSAANYSEPRAQALVEREFNLSYADTLPKWNTLSSGVWWQPADTARLSVEEGIAKTLGIRLGDKLTYDVAGRRFTATVTSLRRVEWDSMRVNFFVIATPELLRDFPASYLASFYLPPERVRAGDALVHAYPNLLLIDTTEIIGEVRSIIAQVSQTVSVVFLFTLACGMVVLYAALLATNDERMQEAAILRTLGADSVYLRRLHLGEFAVVGALSGLFAAGSAAFLGWLLSRYVLEIPYRFDALLWLVGVMGGMTLVMLAGWLNTRKWLKITPNCIFRGD